MPKDTILFSNLLIKWYLRKKRELPWRGSKDPYCVWLSEIILQQTRVAQGLPYYLKFVNAYPTVKKLANAPQEEVLKLWQGLGYYSRARNLHATAQHVDAQLNGVFPNSYKGLLKLKGVGDYTASAIASICYDAPMAVVDGNVYRVLSRVFGIDTAINTTQGQKEFKALAQELLLTTDPGTYNQAIMEFGARHCVPQSPDCNTCIFNDQCVAFQQDSVTQLPVKLKKQKAKKRYFNYMVVLTTENETILEQRTKKGIWQQLYQFPLLETSDIMELKELRELDEFKEFMERFKPSEITLFNEEPVVHKLSHQHLYTQFWIVETSQLLEKTIPLPNIEDYAVPVLVHNFIEQFFNHEAAHSKG